MPKIKIVATGPLTFSRGTKHRRWIETTTPDDRIISVAGVRWEDIPMIERMLDDVTALGRDGDAVASKLSPYGLAVRADLTEADFEVEIINA